MTYGTIEVGQQYSAEPNNYNPIYFFKTWGGEDSAYSIGYKNVTRIKYKYVGRGKDRKREAIFVSRLKPYRIYATSSEHNYSVSYIVQRNPSAHYIYNPPGFDLGFISQFGFASGETVDYSNQRLAALNSVFSQIRGHDFNAAIFAAEGGKALEMIANSALRIRLFLRAIRRGDIKKAAESLGVNPKRHARNHGHSASNVLLEFQYGWRPLLNDAYNAVAAIETLSTPQFNARFKARKTVRTDNPKDFNGFTADENFNLWRYQVIALVRRDMSGASSLGLTNPASVAWELLPFSFLADWFIPIGPYLEAVHAAMVTEATYVITEHSSQTAKGATSNDGLWEIAGVPYYKSGSLVRTVSSTVDIPLPVFKPLKKALSLERSLNALALLNNEGLKF